MTHDQVKTTLANVTKSHTPGPWLITNSHIENGEWVTGISSEKENGTIALVIGSKVRVGYVDESLTSNSNACLIAAAPDLLEALKTLLSDFTNPATDEAIRKGPHVALMQQAIAKAEGK